MQIIDPVTITDSILTVSNVPETAPAAYNAGTTYAQDDTCCTGTAGGVLEVWKSKAPANTNNTPASSPAWWKKIAEVYAEHDMVTPWALGAIVQVAATHQVYESLVAANTGNAVTDTTKWLPRGYTNRWKMFDQENKTLTENADSIVVSLTPSQIANGIWLGGVEGDSIAVTSTDPTDGVVFSETVSLIRSSSGSSFFRWCFSRIRRRTFYVSVSLPMYYTATVQVTISKPGGTAKCAMCKLGPVIEVGKTRFGIGADIKDFSSTTFAADGTSKTTLRDYAKRAEMDLLVDNDEIDWVQEQLAEYRQKFVVWIGSTRYGLSIIFGRYAGFKIVVPGPKQSNVNIQVEGAI